MYDDRLFPTKTWQSDAFALFRLLTAALQRYVALSFDVTTHRSDVTLPGLLRTYLIGSGEARYSAISIEMISRPKRIDWIMLRHRFAVPG